MCETAAEGNILLFTVCLGERQRGTLIILRESTVTHLVTFANQEFPSGHAEKGAQLQK